MHYLKRNTKYSILAFFVLILSVTIPISTLAKTEVQFSLSANPQKEIIKNINQAEAFTNIAMHAFSDDEIAQKIIALREELKGFKEPQDLVQLPEITNLDWREWEEQGIIISVSYLQSET